MICTVAGAGAAFSGVATSCLSKSQQRFWSTYAVLTTIIYNINVLAGTILAHRFLVSFEMMLLFCFFGGCSIFIITARQYYRNRDTLTKHYLGIWIDLVVVIMVYYLYYMGGFAVELWSHGIWFSENDVLHVLMMAWVLGIYFVLRNDLKDLQTSTSDKDSNIT